ncbi:MAG: YitT family protein [Bacteroidales bacterium]|nr:YitT family protein [Bacteroidales bacterium]
MNEKHFVINRLVRDYFVLTLASFIFAFAWEGFMIPNGMSAGGMMGLCTIIQYATGGLIQAQYSYFAINALLLIIAVLAMGIGFGFKTIYCIIMTSVAMQILGSIPAIHCIQGGFFFVRETLLIPIIAGALEAVGIGLVLRNGGSTGGTDIIALMVNKYWPVSLSTAFLVSDLIVCSLLLLLPEKHFADMCYGLVELVTFSLMIDMVVGGKKSSYQLLVFSDRYSEIADHIISRMDRGVTVLRAMGWFTRKERNVLLILISQKQFPSLSRAIKDIDPKAFMSVSQTHNVYGEGFEEIKAGVHTHKKKQNENHD